MIFLGCNSAMRYWEIPASHPANTKAEEAKISKPLNPFKANQSIEPYRLNATQPLNQDSRSEGISSHDMKHSGHSDNMVRPKSGNEGHSKKKDIVHNHKENN